ncbi:MAG: NUDIX hydrolase [Bacteroidetes bacterium]|nr:NUDIX hydrolase [Bacteroidota bacterium]
MPHRHDLNPRVSVDNVILGFDDENLNVLLIGRSLADGKMDDVLALPGDLIYENENLDMAAQRVLHELTGLTNLFLQQAGAFGDPDRLSKPKDRAWLKTVRQEPEVRVITIAYFTLINMHEFAPQPASFAQSVQWVPIQDIGDLAFDHNQILKTCLSRLQETIAIKPVGFNLLPTKFTLGQLHKLYEAILEKPLDKRNFRRKIQKLGILTHLDEKQAGVPHKPSRFYKFNEIKYRELAETGFDNFGF